MRTRASRPLWSFFLALGLSAFAMNWVWEMVQMPGYVEMAGRSWADTFRLCTRATGGDVLLTFGVYGVGALAAGEVRWGATGRWNVYAAATLLSAGLAAAVEWKALAEGRWSYTDRMPIVPVVLLQLTLLVPTALWVGRRITGAGAGPAAHRH